MQHTWIDPEEVCYPSGGKLRNARAFVNLPTPGGSLPRTVTAMAGIPDTVFSIPATVRVRGKSVTGFLSVCGHVESDHVNVPECELMFTAYSYRKNAGVIPAWPRS